VTACIPQSNFFFYRNRPIQCDFPGGQITSAAGRLETGAQFTLNHQVCNDSHEEPSRKVRSLLDRDGWRNLLSAFASI
jgi:hypothetical protein